jgi:hypothetical protein
VHTIERARGSEHPDSLVLKNHDEFHGEKSSGQYLDFICDESLTRRCWNLNPGHFRGSATLPLFVWRIVFACPVVCR